MCFSMCLGPNRGGRHYIIKRNHRQIWWSTKIVQRRGVWTWRTTHRGCFCLYAWMRPRLYTRLCTRLYTSSAPTVLHEVVRHEHTCAKHVSVCMSMHTPTRRCKRKACTFGPPWGTSGCAWSHSTCLRRRMPKHVSKICLSSSPRVQTCLNTCVKRCLNTCLNTFFKDV